MLRGCPTTLLDISLSYDVTGVSGRRHATQLSYLELLSFQEAASVTTFEILNEPSRTRMKSNPWPTWPRIFRVEYGHEEVSNQSFLSFLQPFIFK